MTYLFSAAGLKALDTAVARSPLYAFDFDGTLAPIVRRPEAAAIAPATLKLLRELGRHAQIAVISGRGLSDLRSRMGRSAFRMVGNHGAEGLAGVRHAAAAARRINSGWKRALDAEWGRFEGDPGVYIEDKRLTMALHYRLARDPLGAESVLRGLVAKLRPAPRVLPGLYAWNLMPKGIPNKGTAVRELLRESGACFALFVGDEETDEDAFALGPERVFGVRVGLDRDSRAGYYLRTQGEIGRLIREILARGAGARTR